MAGKQFTEAQLVYTPKENDGKFMKQFMKSIETKYGVKFGCYWDFHRWSIENTVEFWAEIWNLSGIISSKSFDKVVDLSIPMSDSPEWFQGAKLNFAENLLRHRDDTIALITIGEDKHAKKYTFAEMYDEAKLYAAAFRKFGLKKGDVVACYMSNREEPVFAMQATVSIGAMWTGVFPMFGAQVAVNRLKIVNPKILLTMDRCLYNGTEINLLTKVKEISNDLPSLEKILIVSSRKESKEKDISEIKNGCWMDDFLATGRDLNGSIPEMVFEQVPFSHPVFIIYTSGTTGPPKALIHGPGILLSEFKEFQLHNDSFKGSVWLNSTPLGGTMWFQYATTHFMGYTLLLYDGFPYFITPTNLWDIIDEFKVTNLFLPATVLDELNKRGYIPTERHHLSSLRIFHTGGSIVKPQCFDFAYGKVKKDVIFSGSHGTSETLQSPLTFDTTMPVYKGEYPIVTLGMDLQCLDDNGKNVEEEVGELVLGKPFPSLVMRIWGDTDRSIFKRKYFPKEEDKFYIGDYGLRNPITKGFIIQGRSDDTLKVHGLRIGSVEIYNIVESFPEVDDSICVVQYSNQLNTRIVLFLKLKNGYRLDEALIKQIQNAIARELSKAFIPEVILETPYIPYNPNNKKLETVVKNIINRKPYNVEALINADCLKHFENVVSPYIE